MKLILYKIGSISICALALLYGNASAETCPVVSYDGSTSDPLINGGNLRGNDWVITSGSLTKGRPTTFTLMLAIVGMNPDSGDSVRCVYGKDDGTKFFLKKVKFLESPEQLVLSDSSFWKKTNVPNERRCEISSSSKDPCIFYEAHNTTIPKKNFEKALRNYASNLGNDGLEKEYEKALVDYAMILWSCIEHESYCKKDSSPYDLTLVQVLAEIANEMSQKGYMDDSQKYVTYQYNQFLYLKYSNLLKQNKALSEVR